MKKVQRYSAIQHSQFVQRVAQVSSAILAPVAKPEIGRMLQKSQMQQVNQKLNILQAFINCSSALEYKNIVKKTSSKVQKKKLLQTNRKGAKKFAIVILQFLKRGLSGDLSTIGGTESCWYINRLQHVQCKSGSPT